MWTPSCKCNLCTHTCTVHQYTARVHIHVRHKKIVCPQKCTVPSCIECGDLGYQVLGLPGSGIHDVRVHTLIALCLRIHPFHHSLVEHLQINNSLPIQMIFSLPLPSSMVWTIPHLYVRRHNPDHGRLIQPIDPSTTMKRRALVHFQMMHHEFSSLVRILILVHTEDVCKKRRE